MDGMFELTEFSDAFLRGAAHLLSGPGANGDLGTYSESPHLVLAAPDVRALAWRPGHVLEGALLWGGPGWRAQPHHEHHHHHHTQHAVSVRSVVEGNGQ